MLPLEELIMKQQQTIDLLSEIIRQKQIEIDSLKEGTKQPEISQKRSDAGKKGAEVRWTKEQKFAKLIENKPLKFPVDCTSCKLSMVGIQDRYMRETKGKCENYHVGCLPAELKFPGEVTKPILKTEVAVATKKAITPLVVAKTTVQTNEICTDDMLVDWAKDSLEEYN